MNHNITIFICFAYSLGSISSAIIICKIFALQDPRSNGSNNPGATNVMRIGGKIPATLTLLADASKGLLPVILAKILGYNLMDSATIGCAAILGHMYPVFFKFKGGKGVATTLGVSLALQFWFGLSILASWIIIARITKISSVAAIACSFLAPIYAYILLDNDIVWIISCISISVLLKHRSNLKRIFKGEESTA